MDDTQFLAAFERCEIPAESFHHRDHVRLAWIYLRRYGPDGAAARISASIRRFAEHHGAGHKYHETITLGWMRLVERAMRRGATGASFEDLVVMFPELLDKNNLGEYYSTSVLASEAARRNWVEPDLKRLDSTAGVASPQ